MMKTRFLTLLLAIVVGTGTLFAETVQIGNLSYSLYHIPNTARVVSGNYSNLTAVSIPSQITYENETYDVTIIDVRAFKDCSNIVSVTIPNGIEIGAYAFENCTGLTSVTLPDDIMVVSKGLFMFCTNLASITIPESVTEIYNEAFYGCHALTTITLPSNVTKIGESAFAECVNLTSISFPASVNTLGDYAFMRCFSLLSLEVPNTIANIGEQVFYRVPNIIYSGSSSDAPWGAQCMNGYVENQWVYSDATKITLLAGAVYSESNVVIPEGVNNIGNEVFKEFNNLETLIISDGINIIGDDAFAECENLSSLEIPASVTSIGYGAFAYCSNIASIMCRADVPSTLDYDVFTGVDKSIPLYVPSSSITAYQVADGWKDFTNIQAIPGTEPAPCLLASGTCGAQGNNLTWELDCDSVLTISGTGAMKNAYSTSDIPWHSNRDKIKSVIIESGVTSIGYAAFYKCNNLKTIDIPSSVTSIGQGAFFNCSALTTADIPNSVNSIGQGAFSGCSSLTSIAIPNSVTSIGKWTFYRCGSLASVTIGNSVIGIADYAFESCWNLASVEIPNSVTSIGHWAFAFCGAMTALTIGNSVANIGSEAFLDCNKLESVVVAGDNATFDSREGCNALIETATNTLLLGCKNTVIPNSIAHIGDYAFYECEGITTVTIPENVLSIGKSAFDICSNVGWAGVEEWDPINEMSGMAPAKRNALRSINTCENVTSITSNAVVPPTLGQYVFGNVETSIPLYVPAQSVEAYQAADGWKDFTNIQAISGTEVPTCPFTGTCGAEGDNLTWELSCEGVLTISGTGAMAYYTSSSAVPWSSYRSSITSVVIYDGVISIGDYAFSNCTSLTSIDIPNSVTSIGYNAFRECSGLTSIDIPNSVTSIGNYAFSNCSSLPIIDNIRYADTYLVEAVDKSLSSYTIKERTRWVGDYAFSNCTSLTSIEIPNSVTSIGVSAFSNCTGMTSIEIPNNVTSIEGSAFKNCTGLTSIEIPNSVTSIGNDAFSNCSSLTYVTIPNSVTSIGSRAFKKCTNLTSLTIPNSVTSIEYETFYKCTSLTSIEIPYRVTSIGNDAFYGCAGLTTIEIPACVTNIGGQAFKLCKGLTSITCNAITPPTMEFGAFTDVNKSIPLYVPTESGDAYKAADQWKNFTNIQPICQSLSYSAISMDETKGSVEIVNEQNACESIMVTLRAVPKPGYMFTMWNDGWEEAERTVTITETDYNGYTFIACFYNTISFTDLSVIETTPYTITVAAHTNLPDMEAGPDDNPRWAGFELEYTNGESGGGFITQCAVQDGYMTATIDLHHPWASGALSQYPFDEVYWRPYYTSEAEWNEVLGTWHNEHIVGESMEIPEWKKGYIFPADPVVIADGENPELDDLDESGTGTIAEIEVQPGGELNVSLTDIRIGELIITTDGVHSGQVHHGNYTVPADHIYLEYILNPWGMSASPDRWYAFSVPFEVEINGGVSRTCDHKALVSGTDFLILEYNGLKRALQGKGWSEKLNGTLEPGHFYMIGIDGTCNRWRFEKKADRPVEGNTHMAFNGYASDNSKDAGWNGMGNTRLEYTGMDMGSTGITYMVTYDNRHGKYETHRIDEMDLFVGQPFFIQASGDGYFDFHHGGVPYLTPSREGGQTAEPGMHFTLSNENQTAGTDHLYLTMHEDAAATYTIGRDVERMTSDCRTAAQLWCSVDNMLLNAHGIAMPSPVTTVNLGLYAPAQGEYILKMTSTAMENYQVELLYNGVSQAILFDAQPLTLNLSKGNNSGYTLRITRKTPTGLGEVQSDKAQSTKELIDGMLYIFHNGRMYDAQGQMVK